MAKPTKKPVKPLPARRPKAGKPATNLAETNEVLGPIKAEDTKAVHRFCFDHERRTCLVVSQDEQVTRFIPLETESGLCVCSTSTQQFDARFKTVPNHSLDRGAALYARYAIEVGATPEVMSFLGNFTPITKQEAIMATNRKKTNDETAATKKVDAKAKAKKPAEPKAEKAPFAGGKKVEAPAKAAPAKTGEKKPTASKMFCDLIMEGKLSDDKIFEKVQAKFGLDDSKRGYVKWYRNDLKKKGMNPPEGK